MLKTFLLGDKVSAEDFYLANKLKQIPNFSKLLSSKLKPYHICRWFNQVFSVYPDEGFELYQRHRSVIDTRLSEAIKSGDMKKFESLLGLVNLNARDSRCGGPRPIHIACEMGNMQALKILLDRGASLETLDEEGLTPLFYSVRCKDICMFKYLISIGANIFHEEYQKRSLFYWAASTLRLDILEELLEKGLDPNSKTVLGRTAISKAAWNGTANILKFLIEIPGIEIDTPDARGRTPLHNAVWGCAGGRLGKKMGKNSSDSAECAKLLLDHGANIEAIDNALNTPLCIASSTSAVESLKLLIKYGANLYHSNGEGYLPLHQAIAREHIECAIILLENGVDINLESKNHRTPLEVAIEFGEEKSVDLLINYRAKCNTEILKYCIKIGTPKILEKLFNYTDE